MEQRRRRDITKSGAYVCEDWFEPHVDGALPIWLRNLGQWVYSPSEPTVELLPACIVVLVPMQTIVLAYYGAAKARERAKIVTIDSYRPHPAKQAKTYRITAGAGLVACRPAQQKSVVMAVYTTAQTGAGICQLRFEAWPNQKIHATARAIERVGT